nr:MAG TPA: hypothetical protein [Caudoviricetes sp.]
MHPKNRLWLQVRCIIIPSHYYLIYGRSKYFNFTR